MSAPTHHMAQASRTVSAPMPNRVCTYALPCLQLCLTMSATMPNCVANASMCVLPNLTQHKTNPICLHLPTMWCTCLTMSAPMPNCVCTYPLPCMHLHLTVWCIQACVANGRPNPMSAPTYMWRMHNQYKINLHKF